MTRTFKSAVKRFIRRFARPDDYGSPKGELTALRQLPPVDAAETLVGWVGKFLKGRTPREALRFLFTLDTHLYLLEGRTAIAYGNGVHPKHRITDYHAFFVSSVRPGESVLDVGSGKGILSYEVVSKVPGAKVTGLEISEKRVLASREKYSHANLRFVHGDVFNDMPETHFDVVLLSNILEHVEKRTELLREIVRKAAPDRLIIRVPQYNRDWRLPLKEELGLNALYPGHFVEYTKESFIRELEAAKLKVLSMEFKWGEIWSVVSP